MSFFRAAALSICLVWPSLSNAETFTVGGKQIRFPPAEGFCRLVPENETEEEYLSSGAQRLDQARLRLLAIDIQCKDLEAWRSGLVMHPYRYTQLSVDKNFEGRTTNKTGAYIKNYCAAIRLMSDTKFTQALHDRNDKAAKYSGVDDSGWKYHNLGVLSESSGACFHATSSTITSVGINTLAVTAVVIVKGEPIHYLVYSPARITTTATLLESHRANVKALLTANGGR